MSTEAWALLFREEDQLFRQMPNVFGDAERRIQQDLDRVRAVAALVEPFAKKPKTHLETFALAGLLHLQSDLDEKTGRLREARKTLPVYEETRREFEGELKKRVAADELLATGTLDAAEALRRAEAVTIAVARIAFVALKSDRKTMIANAHAAAVRANSEQMFRALLEARREMEAIVAVYLDPDPMMGGPEHARTLALKFRVAALTLEIRQPSVLDILIEKRNLVHVQLCAIAALQWIGEFEKRIADFTTDEVLIHVPETLFGAPPGEPTTELASAPKMQPRVRARKGILKDDLASIYVALFDGVFAAGQGKAATAGWVNAP